MSLPAGTQAHKTPSPAERGPRPAGLAAPSLELLERVKEGDKASLNLLTRSIRPHVERQLARYPVSDDDRLDLVQSTLLQVVRRIQSFRGDSSFTTWLFRVTANEALMLMRSQRRQRARIVEGLDFEDLSALPTMRVSPGDDDVVARILHAAYGAAYLHAARAVASDEEIEATAGVSIARLRAAADAQQRAAVRALSAAIAPPPIAASFAHQSEKNVERMPAYRPR